MRIEAACLAKGNTSAGRLLQPAPPVPLSCMVNRIRFSAEMATKYLHDIRARSIAGTAQSLC
jgi:hypothetical protein